VTNNVDCETSVDFICISFAVHSFETVVLVTKWFSPRRTCEQGVCQGVCESQNKLPCTCSRGSKTEEWIW